jgi:hypothetical protein
LLNILAKISKAGALFKSLREPRLMVTIALAARPGRGRRFVCSRGGEGAPSAATKSFTLKI